MALQIIDTPRIFKFEKDSETIKLPEVNALMTPDEVKRHYSSIYPELTIANVTGPYMVNHVAEYKFESKLGVKG